MKNNQLYKITVHTLNASASTGRLLFGNRYLPCSLGRGGIRATKHEGDGATPRGNMQMHRLYFRPDRLRRPKSGLPTHALHPAMGWCDAPDDPNYNQLVSWPYQASAERLWRQDHIYDLFVVLGYNISPRKKFRGSAIFWHLAREDFSPTLGCIAIQKGEMIKLLEICTTQTSIIVE